MPSALARRDGQVHREGFPLGIRGNWFCVTFAVLWRPKLRCQEPRFHKPRGTKRTRREVPHFSGTKPWLYSTSHRWPSLKSFYQAVFAVHASAPALFYGPGSCRGKPGGGNLRVASFREGRLAKAVWLFETLGGTGSKLEISWSRRRALSDEPGLAPQLHPEPALGRQT